MTLHEFESALVNVWQSDSLQDSRWNIFFYNVPDLFFSDLLEMSYIFQTKNLLAANYK